MAHTCNPSYSGGRDQAVRSQPKQIVHETLAKKKKHQKRAGEVA
jgi:hypothetical protein